VSQTRNWCITLAFLTLEVLSTVERAEPPPPQPAPPLVFMHVTVIDATGAPPQPDMTVVITGDRIAEIGLTQHVRVPDEAHVVDATGKFLIPGLWDMHVHWYLKDFLPLFIANGVTGVRQMWGMPLHHAWRQDIERGTLLGPRMSIASPIVDGPNPIWPGSVVVRNAAEGRQAVTRLKQAGAEFIKVYDLLPRDAYFAIADEARHKGCPLPGMSRTLCRRRKQQKQDSTASSISPGSSRRARRAKRRCAESVWRPLWVAHRASAGPVWRACARWSA
jgi:hypothetical protein